MLKIEDYSTAVGNKGSGSNIKDDKEELNILRETIGRFLEFSSSAMYNREMEIELIPGNKDSFSSMIIRLNLDHPQSEQTVKDRNDKAPPKWVFSRKLTAVMEKSYHDSDFNVERLAKKLNLSQSSLHRKMTKLNGRTPCSYITDFRLERAAQLLRDNFGSVTEVAFEVGFSSRSYFTRCFKKKYNILPSRYHLLFD